MVWSRIPPQDMDLFKGYEVDVKLDDVLIKKKTQPFLCF